jgi:hypothetical protein
MNDVPQTCHPEPAKWKQHLAKDYKDFTCLSPNAFHEIENSAPERSFGLSEGYYE